MNQRPIKGHPGRRLEEWLERTFPRAFARLYRLQARLMMRPFYRTVAQDIASHVQAGHVLDIGTGPGLLPLEMSRTAPSLEVAALDISHSMAALGRRASSSARVSFLAADVSHLPFTANTFDLAVTTLSLHHWFDQVAGLAEVWRVLKPGGSAWVYEPRDKAGGAAFQELAARTPFGACDYSERRVKMGWFTERLSVLRLTKEV